MLNWKEESLTLRAEEKTLGSVRKWKLVLELSQHQKIRLKETLQELDQVEHFPELRVDFPALPNEAWTLYWKKTEQSESRVLLARPEPGEKVGTIALTPTHWELVLSALKDGSPFSLGQLARLQFLSNLEVEFL